MTAGNNLVGDGFGLLNVLTVLSPVETVETTITSVNIALYPTDIRTA
jgi:hypothetical protein